MAMASDLKTLDPAQALREVIRTIRDHEAELRALGVAKLWLFGSLARGDARPESDVDVLIDIDPGKKFSLLDLAAVRLALCDLLGRETGVVIREDLRARFRDRIADDLVEAF
jgi:predicted nucleotidyltransferase